MRLKKCLAALLLAVMIIGAVPAFAAYNKPYYIEVDLTNQITTVYNTADGSIARQMLCSTGAAGHETITGTYYLPYKDRSDERSEWYTFHALDVYAKYATRISGPYLFHSIPCYSKDLEDVVPRYVREFGMPASHGCVRMRVEDAEFIAKECLAGTRTYIYYSEELNEDLRQLLFISSFTGENGMTYREFLGISEDALGSGSSGTKVLDLQHRLADLGYYGGQLDGTYNNDTVAAVKKLQSDLGVAETGITYDSLYNVIFSDEAPIAGGQITLHEGKSGPAVEKLQQALAAMGLYTGQIDGIMDLEVTQAIEQFQIACGYEVDGKATPEIQHAVYYQLEQLEKTFGADSIPALEAVTEEIWQGTLDAKANILIRAEKSTESSALGKVKIGESVIVLDAEDKKWAQIHAGGVTGYIYKKYLSDPVQKANYILKYTGNDGQVYTIGRTMEEFLRGDESEASVMADIFASEEFNSEHAGGTIQYITVATGSDGVNLNLRAQPSSDAEVLIEVPNGTDLRVISRDDEWTRVGYANEIGYLMNRYLNLWEGDADALVEEYHTIDSLSDAGVAIEDMGGNATAIVVAPKQSKPYLYTDSDLSSDKYTTMAVGVEVEILEYIRDIEKYDDHWLKVGYMGQIGYMRASCLQFEYEGA